MDQMTNQEPTNEPNRKHIPKGHDLTKKQKLKKVIKDWSKGESKWTFKAGLVDDDISASYERSSDIPKRHNRQNTERPKSFKKHITDLTGLVIESKGLAVKVQTSDGAYVCKPFRSTISENPDATLVVTGDEVTIKPIVQPKDNEPGEGLILRIKARRTKLCRSRERETNRSGEAEHVIASNIDQLFVVSSIAEPEFRAGLVDRYLAYAAYERITPIILINKIDLAEEGELEAIKTIYEPLGYSVIGVSAEKNIGLELLKKRLVDKISVFSGHSGVGKTTLLNALTGLNMTIGEVSEKSLKGSHTTSFALMLTVTDEGGEKGYVIDTPGIREFGLTFIPREELRHTFIEFLKFAPECRYPSCTHTNEPDCAVIIAIQNGKIAASRFESYLSIFNHTIG